jgi:hypothetical protein
MPRVRWGLLITVVATVGGAAIWWYNQNLMSSYLTFTNEHLGVRFQYPKGWNVREINRPSGRVFGEVQIFGPRREDLEHSIYVDVSAESVSAEAPVTLEGAVEASLAELRRFPTYRILEQKPRRIAGRNGVGVASSYQLMLPLKARNRKTVEFREEIVYCLRDNRLFRLTFAAPVEDFERCRHAFIRLTKSFAFLP